MTFDRIALAINDLLGIVLVIRLLTLRLHRIYKVFCFLVLMEVLGTSVIVLEIFANVLDYRKTWLMLTVPGWIVLLWLVYVFLGAVLAKLQGILTLSRKILNIAFVASAMLAVLGAHSAFKAVGGHGLAATLQAALLMDCVVSTTALLVILAVLTFVLWFPVEMPRNLVVFSFGLIVYFAAQIAVSLLRNVVPGIDRQYFGGTAVLLGAGCFLYWNLFITAGGERVPVRIGHRWRPEEQKRLLNQLEDLNAALLRSARRS